MPDAVEALRRTNKKGARIVETLLRSAIANASHNDGQNPQSMIVKTIVVNQGMAYHRGVPMARGRVRPMRKFLSHISITLGFADDDADTSAKKAKTATATKKATKVEGKTSQSAKNQVKKASPSKKQTTSEKKSSDSSESVVSSEPQS